MSKETVETPKGLKTIDWKKLKKELKKIYKEYDLPSKGLYDPYGCDQPCCNELAVPTERLARSEKVSKLLEKYGFEEDHANWNFYPTEIPSISSIIESLRVVSCNHSMTLIGKSSSTSQGPKDLFECIYCKLRRYN